MLDSKFWRIGGGVYFDTDVEVIRSLDEIIAKGPFLGEQVKGRVAAGLGMAAVVLCQEKVQIKYNQFSLFM